jgi:hypothetical protein
MGIVREFKGRRMYAVESRYQATASEDVTVNISVCVTVNCKAQSRAVSKSPINSVMNPKQVYNHIQSRDNVMETADV